MRSADEILQEGIRAGQIGGDSEPHGLHAMGFTAFLGQEEALQGHCIDLGSGVGIPGLILADAYPETTWTLVERRQGRTDLLRRAVRRLELADRVEVFTGDATEAAHSSLRAAADWVTARSFGPPGETAECATGFLRVGGSLVTSEPFDGDLEQRWPAESVEIATGLAREAEWTTDAGRYLRFVRTERDLPALPRKGARKIPLF